MYMFYDFAGDIRLVCFDFLSCKLVQCLLFSNHLGCYKMR